MADNLNPNHYRSHPSGIECIEITQHMDFLTGNAMKYLWRAGLKDDRIEDLKKAKWYIERLIANEPKETKNCTLCTQYTLCTKYLPDETIRPMKVCRSYDEIIPVEAEDNPTSCIECSQFLQCDLDAPRLIPCKAFDEMLPTVPVYEPPMPVVVKACTLCSTYPYCRKDGVAWPTEPCRYFDTIKE